LAISRQLKILAEAMCISQNYRSEVRNNSTLKERIGLFCANWNQPQSQTEFQLAIPLLNPENRTDNPKME